MKDIIKLIAELVNNAHDILAEIIHSFGFNLTDKDLHFWIMGIIGIFIFIFTQVLFKLLANWSITALSFIYTFTVMFVIVFAIEIQQKITGRGNMEFADAVVGIYGFLAFFGVFLISKLILKSITILKKRFSQKNHNTRASRHS